MVPFDDGAHGRQADTDAVKLGDGVQVVHEPLLRIAQFFAGQRFVYRYACLDMG